MAKTSKSASTARTRSKAKLTSDLQAAEARWREEKRKARVAKTAAKEAKKAVKRLRKLVREEKEKAAALKTATSARRTTARAKPSRSRVGSKSRVGGNKKLRIAGTPESRRVRAKRKRVSPPPQGDTALGDQSASSPAQKPPGTSDRDNGG